MQANDLKSWAWPRACGSDYRPRHLILNVLIQICSLLRITNTLLESELMGKDSGQAACCGRNTIFEWRERHAPQTAESCICRSSCRWRRMRSATRGSMINEAMRMREPQEESRGLAPKIFLSRRDHVLQASWERSEWSPSSLACALSAAAPCFTTEPQHRPSAIVAQAACGHVRTGRAMPAEWRSSSAGRARRRECGR